MPEYEEIRNYRAARTADSGELWVPGDPEATGPAILELVDADEPPLRTFFGTGTLDMIREEYAKRIENWENWDHLAVAAQGGVKEPGPRQRGTNRSVSGVPEVAR